MNRTNDYLKKPMVQKERLQVPLRQRKSRNSLFDEISIRRIPSCVKVKAITSSPDGTGVPFRGNEQTKIM